VLAGLAQPCAVERDLLDAGAIRAEHDVALQNAGRVVEVHDGLLGTDQRLVGAGDQVLARLGQHLDRDVVGNRIVFDQLAHEVEVGLARAREADLDLLVAHLHEQVEHDALALGAHRIDERLVAVAQVDRAPARSFGDALRRPGAVGQFDVDDLVVRTVPVGRHARGLLRVLHGLVLFSRSRLKVCSANTKGRDEGG